MQEVKIGGVPEHFNYPWLRCIEENYFSRAGIHVSWKNCDGGTGQMISDLQTKEIDLAIMLTEGSIKEIESGASFSIIQKYIETPLIWGVFVNADSNIKHLEQLSDKIAAISRINSGSHLMTYVLADSYKWNINKIRFQECLNLKGAFESLKHGTSDYLLWEKFTTLPYLSTNNLRHVGNCPTPWPCFVIVCRAEYELLNSSLIQSLLNIINNYTLNFKNIKGIARDLAKEYHMSEEETNEWLSITKWSQHKLEQEVYNSILDKIKSYRIIS